MTSREPKLPLTEAVALVLGVSRCLSALHRLGAFHNNIKPSNVLIDESGRGVLSDFDRLSSVDLLEFDEIRRGSREFAAPELLLSGRGGASADVYSMGMTLLFLIERRVPPTNVAWRRNPSLAYLAGQTHELTQVIERAIAFDPSERYETMDEFASELEKVVEHVRDVESVNEVDVFDLLLSMENGRAALPRLCQIVGSRNVVRHPSASWRTVALSLSNEAAKQDRLAELKQEILQASHGAEEAVRERRIRLAIGSNTQRDLRDNAWSLLAGLCELAPDNLEEVLHRTGSWGKIDSSGSVLEVAASLIIYCKPDSSALVEAICHSGGELQFEYPDSSSVGSQDACLMFAALRYLGVIPDMILGTDGTRRLLEWRPHLDRHRVNAEVAVGWEQARDRWSDMPNDQRGAMVKFFDTALAIARRLSLWVPPKNVMGPLHRSRVAMALRCAPESVFNGVRRKLSIPNWVQPMPSYGVREFADNMCLFVDTWCGDLERVPRVLAETYAEYLVGHQESRQLYVELATVGLSEYARKLAEEYSRALQGKAELRFARSLRRSAEALLKGAVDPRWFSSLRREVEPPERHEVTEFRDGVLCQLDPDRFDQLLTELEPDMSRIPGVGAPQVTRADEFCQAAIEEGVWDSFRQEAGAWQNPNA